MADDVNTSTKEQPLNFKEEFEVLKEKVSGIQKNLTEDYQGGNKKKAEEEKKSLWDSLKDNIKKAASSAKYYLAFAVIGIFLWPLALALAVTYFFRKPLVKALKGSVYRFENFMLAKGSLKEQEAIAPAQEVSKGNTVAANNSPEVASEVKPLLPQDLTTSQQISSSTSESELIQSGQYNPTASGPTATISVDNSVLTPTDVGSNGQRLSVNTDSATTVQSPLVRLSQSPFENPDVSPRVKAGIAAINRQQRAPSQASTNQNPAAVLSKGQSMGR